MVVTSAVAVTLGMEGSDTQVLPKNPIFLVAHSAFVV